MATTAQDLAATLPPAPQYDQAAIDQANLATNALINPPPLPTQLPSAPPGFISPEEAAKIPGLAFTPVGLQHAQNAGTLLAQPPATQLPQSVPPQPNPVPAVSGAANAATGPSKRGPGMVQEFDKQIAADTKAQQEAAQNLAETQRQGAEDQAQAIRDQAVQRQANAAELAAKAEQNARINRQLDAIDAENLNTAKNKTIPDFWAGREGARVGSAITVALAGVGAGLLGSTNNQALTSIQHTIDSYFAREKDKIDNLYKYAEAQGKLNNQTRQSLAQEYLNLKDQHSYVMDAAADRVRAVQAQAKGSADAATTQYLASKLQEEATKDRLNVREIRAKISLQEAQAEEARARAAQGGYLTPGSKTEIQLLGAIDKRMQAVNTEAIGSNKSPGPVKSLGMLEDIKSSLRNALASGDPQTIKAAMASASEQAGSMMSGGKTTQAQLKLLHDLQSASDSFTARLGYYMGHPTEGTNYVQTMINMADQVAREKAHESVEISERANQEHLSPGGIAQTPNAKNRYLSRHAGIFSGATYNGQPIIQTNNGPPTPQAAPAPVQRPAQLPPSMTLNGTTYHLQPDGTYK